MWSRGKSLVDRYTADQKMRPLASWNGNSIVVVASAVTVSTNESCAKMFMSTTGENEAVLDYLGLPLKARYNYHAVVHTIPKGGAFISQYGKLTRKGMKCPQNVLMLFGEDDISKRNQIQFVLSSSSSDVVRVSTELNIRFVHPLCNVSGYWRVANSSSPLKEVVMTGSKSSNDSTFTIQKSGDGFYKFAFGSADKPMSIGLQPIHVSAKLILSKDIDFSVSFHHVF
ncbi:hypothetical protein HID58_085518 [Brassica napus]|uniref:Uncharacterized protein n=1 Tax=Brassica napus TaxID=3708 RepID=A0ABQ7XMT6_BRANA|nr:hypothetical protein HID58_085518 [Brassica napus]